MLVGLISKTLQRNCLFYVVFLIFIVAYINENGMKKIPQQFWLELVRSAQKLMKTQKKDTESSLNRIPLIKPIEIWASNWITAKDCNTEQKENLWVHTGINTWNKYIKEYTF